MSRSDRLRHFSLFEQNSSFTQTNEVAMSSTIVTRGFMTYLRLLEDADIPNIHRWINNPEITRFLGRMLPVTLEEEEKWIQSVDENRKSREGFVFAICTHEEVHIGNMGLHSIDWIHRTATTGALIGEEEFRGKGYGTDAKMHLLKYAFHTLNLRKVKSEVLQYNGASIRYGEKCGYREVGKRKKEYFKEGEYHDLILTEVFREEWEEKWEIYKEECSS